MCKRTGVDHEKVARLDEDVEPAVGGVEGGGSAGGPGAGRVRAEQPELGAAVLDVPRAGVVDLVHVLGAAGHGAGAGGVLAAEDPDAVAVLDLGGVEEGRLCHWQPPPHLRILALSELSGSAM